MRVRSTAAIIVILLMSLLAAPASSAPQSSYLSITIYENGIAGINYTIVLNNTPSISLQLTGKPLKNYGILVVDEKGTPLPYNYYAENNTINVITLSASEAHISYLTSTLTSKAGETWMLRYVSPFRSRVVLPPGAVVTTIAPVPLSANAEGGSLVFIFPAGSVEIQYIIAAPPQPPQNQQAQSKQGQGGQEGSAGEKGTSQSSQPGGSGGASPAQQSPNKKSSTVQPLYILAAVIVVAAAAIVAALAASRRRKALTENLSEEDAAILRALDNLGGEAFQSDIKKLVDMPTTTLWRHIKKLERMGYVTVEKRYGRNYIKLKI